MFRSIGAGLAALCVAAHAAAAQHDITVNADGTYSEPQLTVADGDTVTWDFPDFYRSIVQLAGPPSPPDCTAFAAWDPDADNNFTGPMPQAVSGIVGLAPSERSLAVVPAANATQDCLDNVRFQHGGDLLCSDVPMPDHHILQEVLDHPAVSSVYLRFNWNEIEPQPGLYDFTLLDAEIDRVLAAGKLYSLSIGAGKDGTPEWLGDELHLPILQLRDAGSQADETACGSELWIADPTDPPYGQRYAQMLGGVAEHLKENAARWRALAYVKPSGANLFTEENRLPKECTPGCPICNSAVWAAAGYTPEGLYEFYEDQLDAIAAHFPGKSMAYMLIQDGFPRVLDADHYKGCLTANCEHTIPGVADQTTEILERGVSAHGGAFVVEHNGLGPISLRLDIDPLNPTKIVLVNLCPAGDTHPIDPDPTVGPVLSEYVALPGACPNPWVLFHGANLQYTGWQTGNTWNIPTLAALDLTLQNGLRNSDGIFVEVYEELIWLAGRTGGTLDPSAQVPRTLDNWAFLFHGRRFNAPGLGWPNLPEPFPDSHEHQFLNSGSNSLTYRYTDPAHCDPAVPETIGSITVDPP